MKKVFILISLFFLGCASMQYEFMEGVLSSWNNSHIDEVVERWGYPDDERKVAGRQIYVWDYRVSYSMPSTYTATSETTGFVSGGGTLSGLCRRILEVNEENIVIKWNYSGNNCPFADSGMSPYNSWKR